MVYTLKKFITDCRAALSDNSDNWGREKVRASLCKLLIEDTFVNENCGPKLEAGTSLLYQDADLGFQIVAHIMGHPYEGGPHDHGASWAIYGQESMTAQKMVLPKLKRPRFTGYNRGMLVFSIITKFTQSVVRRGLASFV